MVYGETVRFSAPKSRERAGALSLRRSSGEAHVRRIAMCSSRVTVDGHSSCCLCSSVRAKYLVNGRHYRSRSWLLSAYNRPDRGHVSAVDEVFRPHR